MDERSKGHVTFLGTFEYVMHENGNLYRAQRSNVIATDGYRAGLRFEAPAHMAQGMLARARETFARWEAEDAAAR